jgi:hypothetical protein
MYNRPDHRRRTGQKQVRVAKRMPKPRPIEVDPTMAKRVLVTEKPAEKKKGMFQRLFRRQGR